MNIHAESNEYSGSVESGVVRKWDKKSRLMFLHIGKTGGTSFDAAMQKWARYNLIPTGFYIGKT